MERVELLKLESKATVMVNPTPPSLEFTRFFFPSKQWNTWHQEHQP